MYVRQRFKDFGGGDADFVFGGDFLSVGLEEFLYLFAVELLDLVAADFHRGGESAVLHCEIRQDENVLRLLVGGQMGGRPLDFLLELLVEFVCGKSSGQVFTDIRENIDILAFFADDHGFRDERRILDGVFHMFGMELFAAN